MFLANDAFADRLPQTIFDLFRRSSVTYPNNTALWVDGASISYSELDGITARLAGAIREAVGARRNIGHQLQCGLLVNRSVTAYAGVLATLMAGGVYVPLNPKFPTHRLSEIVSSSAIDVIVVDHRSIEAGKQLLPEIQRPLIVLSPDLDPSDLAKLAPQHRYLSPADIESAAPAGLPISSSADDGAYLLFTSGSTGAPKGVLVSHRNALTYLANVADRYRPGPEDRISQLFDFSFDLSVHDMFLAWGAGACLCCFPHESLIGIANFMRRLELTFWFSVPSAAAFMRQMRMLKPGSYPSLRWSLFCGEALPMSLARAWQEAAPNSIVENLYGPTEATVAFTAYRLPRESDAELESMLTTPIGHPLPQQKVALIDDDGNPVPEGEAGELCLGGAQVTGGYWRAPELTSARFLPPHSANEAETKWYRTGDLAVMTEKHGLLFRGRIDRQVKIRGFRVELLEVENALRVAASTDTVAVIPWPVSEDGFALSLTGFVSGSKKSPTEIIEECHKLLPSYMVPETVHEAVSWPLNPNGKTDYAALKASLVNINV